MQIDFADILAGSIGWIVIVSLFLVSGIWLGSAMGRFATGLAEQEISGG